MRLARVVTRPAVETITPRALVVEVAGARVHVPSGVTRQDVVVVLDALEARARAGAR